MGRVLEENGRVIRRRYRPRDEEFSYPVPVTVYLDKGPGSVWIEGVDLHWIDENRDEWRFPGTLIIASPGGLFGSLWVEENDLHYIDANGDERKVYGPLGSIQNALPGSLWIESVTSLISWITSRTTRAAAGGETSTPRPRDLSRGEDGRRRYPYGTTEFWGGPGVSEYREVNAHDDLTHSDTHADADHNDHGDIAHQDVTHTDVAHSDSHGDTHSDIPHDDVAHTDSHGDHEDHDDVHDDEGPPHRDHDDHSDSHSDIAHSDTSHDDTHSDTHGDVGHGDVAHVDQHTDHNDITHGDTHGDVAHIDIPIYVGKT